MPIKKTASIAFLAAFSLIILAGGIYFLAHDIEKADVQKAPDKIKVEKPAWEVSYFVNYGLGEAKEYKLAITGTSTVFSLLQDISQKENIALDFQVYREMGVFVKSIDEVANGQNNNYWQYWVNGSLGEVAADKKAVKAGDRIEWKFEPAPSF